jgi:hypothetical protein
MGWWMRVRVQYVARRSDRGTGEQFVVDANRRFA